MNVVKNLINKAKTWNGYLEKQCNAYRAKPPGAAMVRYVCVRGIYLYRLLDLKPLRGYYAVPCIIIALRA